MPPLVPRRRHFTRSVPNAPIVANVLLFHHALGCTPGVLGFAHTVREAGHVVHVPDLYDGRRFATLAEGLAYAAAVGIDALTERGVQIAETLPAEIVYAGFSLGVMPAQRLAQTRPGARAAVFAHACVPASAFGSAWPATVPLQIHAMEADPFFVGDGDIEAARTIVASAPDATLFLYPGSRHLFADPTTDDYDDAAAALLTERVLRFLETA